jgi:WD40 repeat protein
MRVLQSEYPRPLDLLAVGPGGHVAAACSLFAARGTVEVWDVGTGAVVHTRSVPEAIGSLAFTPDRRFLLVAELRLIRALDVNTWEAEPEPILCLGHPAFALSADGRRLVIREAWDQVGRVTCLTTADYSLVQTQWTDGSHPSLWFDLPAVSRDGRRAAVVRRPRYGDRPAQAIEVRDGDTGEVLRESHHDAADPVQQLAFTADGTRLLARFLGRTVRAFDAETGEPAGEMVHKGRSFVTGLAVHPAGRAIATSRNNGTVWFWDPATFQVLRSLDWRLGKLVSVAFGPDGTLAAAGTERGQVVVWDVDD